MIKSDQQAPENAETVNPAKLTDEIMTPKPACVGALPQRQTGALSNREGKYLTFSLAEEEYGISILKIKEIIGMMSITSVPQTPKFVKGVINLRSKVIPVVDLRLRFKMEAIDDTEMLDFQVQGAF